MSVFFATQQTCLPSTRVTTAHRPGGRRKQNFSYKWLESTQTWRHKTEGVTTKTPPRAPRGMKQSPERRHLKTTNKSHHKMNDISRSKLNVTKRTHKVQRRWSRTSRAAGRQSESFQESLRKHYEESRTNYTRIQTSTDIKNDPTVETLEVSTIITT